VSGDASRGKIVALLKRPGDSVAADEPIYEIETDKANVSVVSEHTGILAEWLVALGAEIAINHPVARILQTSTESTGLAAHGGNGADKPAAGTVFCEPLNTAEKFEEYSLSERQLTMNRHALYGQLSHVLPATVRRIISWELVARMRVRAHEQYVNLNPSDFQLIAFAVSKAVQLQPKFCSILKSDGVTVRQYSSPDLGFAVPLPEDELTTGVVPCLNDMDLPTFVRLMRSQLRKALAGETQASDKTTLILSSLQKYDIVDATPILVPPAIGVLFIGSPYVGSPRIGLPDEQSTDLMLNMALTFDHRLINGVAAARFLVQCDRQFRLLGGEAAESPCDVA
jgi:pyruvate/2-oxoglutarate dehydrogenase complex dihydrolipoamide acyltransferase (E2) component